MAGRCAFSYESYPRCIQRGVQVDRLFWRPRPFNTQILRCAEADVVGLAPKEIAGLLGGESWPDRRQGKIKAHSLAETRIVEGPRLSRPCRTPHRVTADPQARS